MPWSSYTRPSAALGSICAYAQRELEGCDLTARSEYVLFANALGFALYDAISDDCYGVGEPLYMALVYPEQRESVREAFVESAPIRLGGRKPGDLLPSASSWEEVHDWIESKIALHLTEAAARLAGVDVVALTTCFGQLFANLALAARIKAQSPETIVILGGSTVSGRVGPSVLEEYPAIDFIVQGEGERPFVALLRELAGGEPATKGVVSRKQSPPVPASLWEVDRLDDLPNPSFEEYAELAEELGIAWSVPIEGSRGCWWDRTKRTGNPKATCAFCNLNVQWGGYREKSVSRVVRELDELSELHANTNVYFLDNIIRIRGVPDLARGISALGKDFSIFYEMRANVSPWEVFLLWEAGLNHVQFGIEALSNGVLRKIGKGTTVMQNLQAMRTCAELEIFNSANLIADFPGCTEAEVAETCACIQKYARAYQPCSISRFHLGIEATVDTLREQYGVTNVRNGEASRVGLPAPVWKRLKLFDLQFDVAAKADWAPVRAAVEGWTELHRRTKKPLAFQDGGTFLRVHDRRADTPEILTLGEDHRAVYLLCTETRRGEEVVRRLPAIEPSKVRELLAELVEASLMYEEGGRYLSLAIAARPEHAARRIRALHAAEDAELPGASAE
jgi:ribosomal peptide maturation radical SAM protein 1